MTIYFTADWHLGHKKILTLGHGRPFENIQHHDNTLIRNYNKIVSDDDTCYFLGDICWNQSYESYKKLFEQLNGKKYVILGNHDNKQNIFRCKRDGLIEDVYEMKTIQIGNDRVFLCHYPMREWQGYHAGVPMLYGHTHGNIEDYKQSTDIGVDCWEYEVVSYDELKEYLKSNKPNVG